MAYNFPRREVLINTFTASSSASIALTSAINSNWTTYLIKIRNVLPATNAVSMILTLSTDNGSTYLSSNYHYAVNFQTGSAGSVTASNSAASCTFVTVLSSTASRGFNCDLTFYALNSSISAYYAGLSVHEGSDNFLALIQMYGMNTTTTPINAMKFAMSSGNIASGTFSIYGVQDT